MRGCMRLAGGQRGDGMDTLTRAGYLAHAELPAHRRRVEAARHLIEDAAGHGQPAVMVSGGKDSLALAHLARRTLGNGIQCFFIDSGCEHPAALTTIEALRDAGFRIETVHPEWSVIEMLKAVGALGYDGPAKLDGDWHWADGDFKRILISEPAEAIRARGYPVALLGLRAEESRGRAMSMRRYGPIRTRMDGAIIACPLAWWTGADVFAYCLARDLPLSEIYTRDGHDDRERRRTGTLVGNSSVRYGRWVDIKRDYPGVWMRLTEMFPDMSRWT
jgi:3'-phosphoadenosine 5'-phosphosulfate sulfotransferase (PAPS reductase)/FAD synthetase